MRVEADRARRGYMEGRTAEEASGEAGAADPGVAQESGRDSDQ